MEILSEYHQPAPSPSLRDRHSPRGEANTNALRVALLCSLSPWGEGRGEGVQDHA